MEMMVAGDAPSKKRGFAGGEQQGPRAPLNRG